MLLEEFCLDFPNSNVYTYAMMCVFIDLWCVNTCVYVCVRSDIGHIHLAQGNRTGARRVLDAMLNNTSPSES